MHFIIPGNSFTYVFYLYLYYTILLRLPLSLAIVTGCIIFWNYDRIHDIINSNKTDNNKKVCFINGRGYKMAGLKKLPIGIENFEKLRQEDFYYIDKTRLIEQLLTRWAEDFR